MQAEHRECQNPTPLFSWLQETAFDNPSLAFACAALLESGTQRDRILRDAFNVSIANQPGLARKYLGQVIDRPWITDAGFFPLASLAISIQSEDPENSRKLLLKAAQRYPGLALRDFEGYGADVFEAAARAAPDEAVGLASGTSAGAYRLLESLRKSPSAELQLLARLAADANLPLQVRSRAAIFYRQVSARTLTLAQAVEFSKGPTYFPALVKLRIGAAGDEAKLYDRALESYAEVLFRFDGVSPELKQLTARDLYVLLVYGRTEEDDKLFSAVFDRLLLPKLRNAPPAELLAEVHGLHLRQFLVTAAAHHRLEPFAPLAVRAVHGLEDAEHPMEEAVAAAQIIDAVNDPTRLAELQRAIHAEYNQASTAKPLYGLLAGALARKITPTDPAFAAIASQYRSYFKDDGVLDAAALFSPAGICIQQQFFYDDDDGAESFESFKQTYAHDNAWQWNDHGWYVQVVGKGAAGRRIDIFANVPHPITAKDTDDRRHALAKMMAKSGLSASVVIHRGHTWYVDQSLRYLTPGARLVYLGSCRGIESTYAVVSVARRAQIIATRAIGTQSVNDPLLKAINDELLRGEPSIAWDRFWRKQDARLKHNPSFHDYIPPSRNVAAIMLAAYFAAGQ